MSILEQIEFLEDVLTVPGGAGKSKRAGLVVALGRIRTALETRLTADGRRS
jgi:hypothetical protein